MTTIMVLGALHKNQLWADFLCRLAPKLLAGGSCLVFAGRMIMVAVR